MKDAILLNNENGVALITALMLLVLLTLLGMAATTTSTLEIMIAGNDRAYKQNLYRAESAAVYAAVIMEEQTNPIQILGTTGFPWISPALISDWENTDEFFMNDVYQYWEKSSYSGTEPTPDKGGAGNDAPKLPAGTQYAAVFLGPDPYGTQDDNAAQIKNIWSLYGYSNNNNSKALVELGYGKWLNNSN